jgi:hypothetical protein
MTSIKDNIIVKYIPKYVQKYIPNLDKNRLGPFLQYFGLFVLTLKFLKYAKKILNNLNTFVFNGGSVDFKKYGSWAVVTGCTDGIGKAYTEHLAKLGLNIVLISRTLEKLEKHSKHLHVKYHVKTKVIAVDFTGVKLFSLF